MMTTTVKVLVLVASAHITFATVKLQEHFEWNILDFDYADENVKIRDLFTGRYKPENGLPVGIEIWKDKFFISVPRWKEGIPSTLNYVQLNSPVKNPSLIPYPDLKSNELGNCKEGLSTVYRIHADKCDRLWVLDTGTYGIAETMQSVCPYAINIFDLKTNTKIRRYEFRPEDTNQNTFIANILVDMERSCDDAYAYFSDELGYGLIVYSYKENKSWRFTHSYFMPDPLKGDFNIDGLNFQWGEEGIFGMSLSPKTKAGDRLVYFSPLASHREFVVSNKVLQNSSKVGNSYKDFYALSEREHGHLTAKIMDEDGIQYMNMIDKNAVGCWNSKYVYDSKNIDIVDKDDIGLIFPCDLKIDKYRNLWVLSDRMSNFLIASLDYKEVNFRVYFAPIDVLLKGTVCENKKVIKIHEPVEQFSGHKFVFPYLGTENLLF
nr:unnamed protein product [Callosobruchus chinensis]